MTLHCIRSLLSTSTNCIPHERLFNFQRKSAPGDSIPTSLTRSKSAILKCHVRGSKYEPLVETVCTGFRRGEVILVRGLVVGSEGEVLLVSEEDGVTYVCLRCVVSSLSVVSPLAKFVRNKRMMKK